MMSRSRADLEPDSLKAYQAALTSESGLPPSRATAASDAIRPSGVSGQTSSGPRVTPAICVEQSSPRDMGITLRGGQAGMAQQLLNGPDIGSAVKQVSGEGVTQRVRAYLAVGQDPSNMPLDHGADIAWAGPPPSSIEEEWGLG